MYDFCIMISLSGVKGIRGEPYIWDDLNVHILRFDDWVGWWLI